MKKWVLIVLAIAFFLLAPASRADAQCSVCKKTTQQLGEKPAEGMNAGVLYLAFTPFLLVGYIGYRWWKANGQHNQ